MPQSPIPFGIKSNPARYGHDGLNRLINCYVENAGEGAKVPLPIYAMEGLKSFATLTNGGSCRGMIQVNDDLLYVASGRQVFRVESDGTNTNIGGLPGDGPAFFARNRVSPNPEIVVVADGNKYLIQDANMEPITDTDLSTPNSVTFLDGYHLYGITDGRFFWSGLENASSISANDFATAEGNPDKLKRVFAFNGVVYLFGTDSIEVWVNTGATFPFERLQGPEIDVGCLAAASIAKLRTKTGNTLFFVADDGTVRELSGSSAVQISTPAVERSIDGETEENKALLNAFAYSYRGHFFYVLNGSSFTWVFDASTGQWHERDSVNTLNQSIGRWRAQYYAKFNGKHVVGDYSEGKLYEIDADTYDEAGNHLIMKIISPNFHNYPNRIQVPALFLDIVPGQGLNSTDTHLSDPQVMVRTSKDGGESWSNQRTASVGGLGESKKRIRMNRFGQSKEDGFIFEVSMSAAVKRGFMGGVAEVQRVNP